MGTDLVTLPELSIEQTKAGEALAQVDRLTIQLPALRLKAQAITVTDQATYSDVGAVLSEVRGIRKQGAAIFAPFETVITRMRDFFKTARQRHENAAEQIEGICVAKLKEFENAEREAARKEQAKLNKGKAPEECATVVPNLPCVPGYRKTTTYPIEVTSIDEFLKQYSRAIKTNDKERISFLRTFLTLDEKGLATYARTLKDAARFMQEVPGVRCWKA